MFGECDRSHTRAGGGYITSHSALWAGGNHCMVYGSFFLWWNLLSLQHQAQDCCSTFKSLPWSWKDIVKKAEKPFYVSSGKKSMFYWCNRSTQSSLLGLHIIKVAPVCRQRFQETLTHQFVWTEHGIKRLTPSVSQGTRQAWLLLIWAVPREFPLSECR